MTPPTASPGATAGRILVVEDSPSAQRLLQEVLLRLGAELANIRITGTVLEALTTFTQWRPSVVFIDVELGRGVPSDPLGASNSPSPQDPKDGAELAALFLARNPALKVVICSATDPSDRRVARLLEGGRVAYIAKPLLASKVEETLGRIGPIAAHRTA
ncbi:MAG: response regulator [Thermoplasmata archaeon]|jgi:CheY-like chemotaxis protein|nr:response regulator [Thermoplasmata archaeon]